ncbi:MAG: hypothetical protein ACYDCK_13865 [Thermoplasmatota archaeon]
MNTKPLTGVCPSVHADAAAKANGAPDETEVPKATDATAMPVKVHGVPL